MTELTEDKLSTAAIQQSFNAVNRATTIAHDRNRTFDHRLHALETALERAHDAGLVFHQEKGNLTTMKMEELGKVGVQNLIGIAVGHEMLTKELKEMPYSKEKKAETEKRLNQVAQRLEPQMKDAPMPSKKAEAMSFLKIQRDAITEAINPKFQMTLEDKVQGIDRAAFNLTARERTTKALQAEGVEQKVILQSKRQTQELAAATKERAKAVEKEVKKLPRDDRRKGLEKSLSKSFQSIGKSLGRSR